SRPCGAGGRGTGSGGNSGLADLPPGHARSGPRNHPGLSPSASPYSVISASRLVLDRRRTVFLQKNGATPVQLEVACGNNRVRDARASGEGTEWLRAEVTDSAGSTRSSGRWIHCVDLSMLPSQEGGEVCTVAASR